MYSLANQMYEGITLVAINAWGPKSNGRKGVQLKDDKVKGSCLDPPKVMTSFVKPVMFIMMLIMMIVAMFNVHVDDH